MNKSLKNIVYAFVFSNLLNAELYYLIQKDLIKGVSQINLVTGFFIALFFMLLSLGGNWLVGIIKKQDESKTAFGYLVISVVQLLICMVAALVYILKAAHPNKPMVIVFMITYFIFAIANTINILKVLNAKTEA